MTFGNTVAKKVNEKRKKLGLSMLPIHTIPLVAAEDTKPVSATRIRKSEIDEEGKLILKMIIMPMSTIALPACLTPG